MWVATKRDRRHFFRKWDSWKGTRSLGNFITYLNFWFLQIEDRRVGSLLRGNESRKNTKQSIDCLSHNDISAWWNALTKNIYCWRLVDKCLTHFRPYRLSRQKSNRLEFYSSQGQGYYVVKNKFFSSGDLISENWMANWKNRYSENLIWAKTRKLVACVPKY